MMNKAFKYLIIAAASVLAASCSVKEDRTPCPCWVEVHFAERSEVFAPVNLMGFCEGSDFSDTFRAEMHPDYYLREVEKGYYDFVSIEGAGIRQKRQDMFMLIDYGSQADSVYWHHAEVDATGEEARVVVDFAKQFATVFLDIRKEPGDMKIYRFHVDGNVCGFEIISGRPAEGAFSCEPETLPGSAVTTVRVPRQVDDSMSLRITYDDGEGHASSSDYPLGKYIAGLGYDWNAPELKDIYITVDVIGGRINIGVSGWEHPDGSDFGQVEI